MNHYHTTATFSVGQGAIIELTAVQAQIRKDRLEAMGDGRYRTTQPMQFKKGEELGIDGEIPKAHQELVELLGGPKEAEKPAPIQAPALPHAPEHAKSREHKHGK